MHTLLHSVPSTVQQATTNPHLHQRILALMGKSDSVSCGVNAPVSWVLVDIKICLWPPIVCFPSSVYVLWLYERLMATSSKRAYSISRSTVPRVPSLQQSTANPYLLRRHTQFCLSLCGVPGTWCAQGMFEPSEHLWQVWGLILNAISPLLPSFWGFSLALGREASFFGGIQRSPVDGCSAASCNLGIFKGGDDRTSSYSTILNSVQVYFANKLTYKNIHCSIYCRRL